MSKKEKLILLGWLTLLLGGIVIPEIKVHYKNKYFYRARLETTIVKIEDNASGGKSYDYITKDSITIILLSTTNFNLNKGDSIVKRKDSWFFKVYRKDNNGNYIFFKTYNERHNPDRILDTGNINF